MQKLIDFMEFGCIDDKIYWRTESTDHKTYEVQWRKDHPMAWRYRRLGDVFWKLSKTENILANLTKESVDLATLERKIKFSVLQQIAFADKIVRDAEQAFGEDPVKSAIEDNQRFLRELELAVIKLTNQVQPTSAPKKSGLRLIPNC